MAFDAYIQIAEITGEALDEQYANWIEIIGYKFGANQSTSATASSAGGASSGRTTLTNFTFTKYLDSASCKLLEASCAGQHLKEVKLVVCRAGTRYRKAQVLRSHSRRSDHRRLRPECQRRGADRSDSIELRPHQDHLYAAEAPRRQRGRQRDRRLGPHRQQEVCVRCDHVRGTQLYQSSGAIV